MDTLIERRCWSLCITFQTPSPTEIASTSQRMAAFGCAIPAHNRSAPVKSPVGTVFEITPSLSGPVLFDFMGPADVIAAAIGRGLSVQGSRCASLGKH